MLLLAFLARPLSADEKLKDIACRSIHLNYPGKDAVSFYNEVAIDHSAPGTYFCVCGWDKGYFGLQELGNGKKLLIFSVWDSSSDDPKALDPAKRVELLHKDDKVRIGRFGGEGSGGQSFFDYDWKAGETYRLMVRARIDGERTEYEGWFYVPEDKAWKHLVTFSTITGGNWVCAFTGDESNAHTATHRLDTAIGARGTWNKELMNGTTRTNGERPASPQALAI